MFEEVRAHEEIQNEFVNIAAHEAEDPAAGHRELRGTGCRGRRTGPVRQDSDRGREEAPEAHPGSAGHPEDRPELLQLKRELFAVEGLLSKVVREQELGLRSKKTNILYEPVEGGERALVEADEERLAQVLSNLLSNALEFTEEGTISVKLVNQADASGSRQVTIEIRDTGRGIDPRSCPSCFRSSPQNPGREAGWGCTSQEASSRPTGERSGNATTKTARA